MPGPAMPGTLENRFLPVTKETRDEQLLALFQESAEVPNRRVLVFAVELADVKHAAKLLRETGVPCGQRLEAVGCAHSPAVWFPFVFRLLLKLGEFV